MLICNGAKDLIDGKHTFQQYQERSQEISSYLEKSLRRIKGD